MTTAPTSVAPADATAASHADRSAKPNHPRARTVTRVMAVVLSVLIIGWGALFLTSLFARSIDQRSGTYENITSGQLSTGFETVEILGSPAATTVELVRSWNWSLRGPATQETQQDGVLSVASSCPYTPGLPCRGHIRLVVPADLPVTARTDDGDLTVRDLTGAVTAATLDGDLAASDLSGSLQVTSVDGAINAVGLRSSEVSSETSDGSIRLVFDQAPGTVTARTRDGWVDVVVPDDRTTYLVNTEANDAERTISVPTDPRADRGVDITTRDGSIRVATTP